MKIFSFLKNILIFIIKEIFSFFIKLFLVLFIIIIIIGVASQKFNQKTTINIKDKSYVEINFANKYSETLSNSNILEEDNINFYSLLRIIENIGSDEKIEGIILKLDNSKLDYAQSEEIAEKISKIRSNDKKVIAYFENVNRKNYYLASFADEIYMPSASATTVGIYPYFSQNFYLKKLTDKIGIKFNIIHVGDYKSYMENLANEGMSTQAREDKTRILENNYNHFLDLVSINRKIDREKLAKIIENGELVAASSIDLFVNKLIDRYSYWTDIEEKIGKDKIVSIKDYASLYSQNENLNTNKNIVYVIPLEGEIPDSQMDILSNNSTINVVETIKKLETAKNNKKIKAVILRVNSPGGSALTADIISQRIKELAKEKPVYVSMGSVAASGGYYISANSHKIFVDRNTITGSIGVVSIIPDFSNLIKNNGINIETISQGEYSDLYSSDTFTEKKYNKIYKSNLKVYEDFLDIVSKGRNIEKEKLKNIAEGRIWSGEEAVEIGLADEIGGLDETIFSIVEDNNIEDYSVVVAKDNFNFNNVYKKYSRFLKIDKIDFIKENFFDSYLYNKPITYLPYEILD